MDFNMVARAHLADDIDRLLPVPSTSRCSVGVMVCMRRPCQGVTRYYAVMYTDYRDHGFVCSAGLPGQEVSGSVRVDWLWAL